MEIDISQKILKKVLVNDLKGRCMVGWCRNPLGNNLFVPDLPSAGQKT